MSTPSGTLVAEALALLDSSDTYAVIEFLAEQEPVVAAQVYGALQRELYWKRKSVAPMIAISRAGIQHGMAGAKQTTDEALKFALLDSAKQLAYNLSSFTWPGWDEAGIALTSSDVAVGLDAAHVNLRLAEMLNRPARGKANAHWAIGAMLLATGEYSAATASFVKAREYAAVAEYPDGVRLHDIYLLLAEVLADRENTAAWAAFDAAVAEFQAEDSDDCREYARQLTVAVGVL